MSPDVDVTTIEALEKGEEKSSAMDTDVAFANSVVSLLTNLEPRGNREAKIEIQQVCVKYEYDYKTTQ